MLVLMRRKNQRIQIGNDIMITVTHVSRMGVRLGIEAPPALAIIRLDEAPEDMEGEPRERSPKGETS
jgi:carbon storage regulator